MHGNSRDLWRQVAEEVKARRPLVIATVVRTAGSVPRATGAKMLVFPDGRTCGSVGGGVFESLVARDGLAALGSGASATRIYSFNPVAASPHAFGAVCGGRADVFLEVLVPPDRLLIVGGGHCGRALARVASLLDMRIVVADDRAEFANPPDFPYENVEAVLHLPADFAGLPEPDEHTYVALVSRAYTTDEAALRRVLHSPAAYIGMIGSKKKRETVYQALSADGVTDDALARVHAPIGLNIGADTPEEIAISILAQIIEVRAAARKRAELPATAAVVDG